MASTSTGVVDVQPRRYYKPSNQLQRRVDENGEEIILEGICARKRLQSNVSKYYTSTYFPICVPFCCLLGKFCGTRAVDVWSLCLTHFSIYFMNFNAACMCCPKAEVQIALTDINEIQEVSYVYTTGCCYLGTKIDTTTVRLELKPNKAKDFFLLIFINMDVSAVARVAMIYHLLLISTTVKMQRSLSKKSSSKWLQWSFNEWQWLAIYCDKLSDFVALL